MALSYCIIINKVNSHMHTVGFLHTIFYATTDIKLFATILTVYTVILSLLYFINTVLSLHNILKNYSYCVHLCVYTS